MSAALTPARLRVLTSAAEGHIIRDRWGDDIHGARPACDCGFARSWGITQVGRQAEWLAANGLIEPGASTVAYGWTWRPTSAGLAVLARKPS